MADETKAPKGEKARRTRTAKPLNVVMVFDDFDGRKFHGLSMHRIDANVVNVIADATATGRKFQQVEIPPASSD